VRKASGFPFAPYNRRGFAPAAHPTKRVAKFDGKPEAFRRKAVQPHTILKFDNENAEVTQRNIILSPP